MNACGLVNQRLSVAAQLQCPNPGVFWPYAFLDNAGNPRRARSASMRLRRSSSGSSTSAGTGAAPFSLASLRLLAVRHFAEQVFASARALTGSSASHSLHCLRVLFVCRATLRFSPSSIACRDIPHSLAAAALLMPLSTSFKAFAVFDSSMFMCCPKYPDGRNCNTYDLTNASDKCYTIKSVRDSPCTTTRPLRRER